MESDYRAAEARWSLISPAAVDSAGLTNLPLGLDEETRYPTFKLDLGHGDLVLFYTDALIEAADPQGRLLGEGGLLAAAWGLDLADSRPSTLGLALLGAVTTHRQGAPAGDDVTLVVARHNAGASPRLSLAQKIDVYAKVFGLRPV